MSSPSDPNKPGQGWPGGQDAGDDAGRSAPTAQWQNPAPGGAAPNPWAQAPNPTQQLPSGGAPWEQTRQAPTGQPQPGQPQPGQPAPGQPQPGQWAPQPGQAWGAPGQGAPQGWGGQQGWPGANAPTQVGQGQPPAPAWGAPQPPPFGQQPQYGQPPQFGQQPPQFGAGQYGAAPGRPATSGKGGKAGFAVVLVLLVVVLAVAGVVGFVWPNGGLLRTKTLDQAAAQDGVRQILTQNYGVASVDSVSCPSGQKVEQGASFSCEVAIAGVNRQVVVTFTDSDGTYEVGRPN